MAELVKEFRSRLAAVLDKNFQDIKVGKVPFADPNLTDLAEQIEKRQGRSTRRGCMRRVISDTCSDMVVIVWDPTRPNPSLRGKGCLLQAE